MTYDVFGGTLSLTRSIDLDKNTLKLTDGFSRSSFVRLSSEDAEFTCKLQALMFIYAFCFSLMSYLLFVISYLLVTIGGQLGWLKLFWQSSTLY